MTRFAVFVSLLVSGQSIHISSKHGFPACYNMCDGVSDPCITYDNPGNRCVTQAGCSKYRCVCDAYGFYESPDGGSICIPEDPNFVARSSAQGAANLNN